MTSKEIEQLFINAPGFFAKAKFAIACQAAGQLCNTAPTAAPLYQALRDTGTLGTVTNTNGSPLTGATSRFISQQW